ncbi:MAG: hypothetical protein FWC50_09470 [Planctomycetaceae bacterium]|nr:hypothetical protein [Planctomycetaceae bacterium]
MKCHHSLFYALVTLFVLTGNPLIARNIYVNNETGNDQNDGMSSKVSVGQSGPVKTIMRAFELSNAGDHVVLAATSSPYRESICFFGKKQSGTPAVPFVFDGNGAILDGTDYLSPDVWTYHGGNIFRFKPTNFTHFQLFLDHRPMKKVTVTPGAKQLPTLLPLEWCIFNGFLYVCLEDFKRPYHYSFTYSEKMSGVTLLQCENVRINDLIVQGYQIDGISVVNNTKNIVLDNVVVRGNGRNGLTIGAASSVAVGYSLFGDNLTSQIAVEKNAQVSIYLSGVKENDQLPGTIINLSGIFNKGGFVQNVRYRDVVAQNPDIAKAPDIENLWKPLIPADLPVVEVSADHNGKAAETLEKGGKKSISEMSEQAVQQPSGTDSHVETVLPVDVTPQNNDSLTNLPEKSNSAKPEASGRQEDTGQEDPFAGV